MKRFLVWVVMLAVLAGAGLIGIGTVLPSSYRVERVAIIQAPPERIHEFVGDLRRWDVWSPWQEDDPTIVVTQGPRTTGIGAHQSWTGESGTGELTFTADSPSKGVRYDLIFDAGTWRSIGEVRYVSREAGTEVVWSMSGDVGSSIPGRYFAAVMEFMVGSSFERGLEKLKIAAEADK